MLFSHWYSRVSFFCLSRLKTLHHHTSNCIAQCPDPWSRELPQLWALPLPSSTLEKYKWAAACLSWCGELTLCYLDEPHSHHIRCCVTDNGSPCLWVSGAQQRQQPHSVQFRPNHAALCGRWPLLLSRKSMRFLRGRADNGLFFFSPSSNR